MSGEPVIIGEIVERAGLITSPDEVIPVGPDPRVVSLIHREHDGVIPLYKIAQEGGEFQELGSARTDNLRDLFSRDFITKEIDQDAYFGLHGCWKPRQYESRYQLPGLENPPLRRQKGIQYLTCFHVDLDAYRTGMDRHDAYAAVMKLVDAGTLPPPSLFTISRGVWAIWLLHEVADRGLPLRAYPPALFDRWGACQMQLHQRCEAIGSDPATKHAATITRIPGSVNSKNQRRVGFMIPASVSGRLYSYSLPEMEEALSLVRPAGDIQKALATPRLNSVPERKKGWVARWSETLKAVERLRDYRGGWKVGHRHKAIFVVCLILRHQKASDREAERILGIHLYGMAQPNGDELSLAQAMATFKGRGAKPRMDRPGGISNQAISDLLGVTTEEAAYLSGPRKNLSPWPPAGSRAADHARGSRADIRGKRREAVRAVCERLKSEGLTFTAQDVADRLEAEGWDANKVTALRDMRALGYESAKKWKRKDGGDQGRLFG